MTTSQYNELIALAEAIIAAASNENTAARVGGLFRSIITALQSGDDATAQEATARAAAVAAEAAAREAAITTEAAARADADNTEIAARQQADSTLATNLAAETTARQQAMNSIPKERLSRKPKRKNTK